MISIAYWMDKVMISVGWLQGIIVDNEFLNLESQWGHNTTWIFYIFLKIVQNILYI